MAKRISFLLEAINHAVLVGVRALTIMPLGPKTNTSPLANLSAAFRLMLRGSA
jgi:hypothetical protein